MQLLELALRLLLFLAEQRAEDAAEEPDRIEMIPGWDRLISGSLLTSGPTSTSPTELITPSSTPVTSTVAISSTSVASPSCAPARGTRESCCWMPGDTGVLLLDDGEEVPVARRKRPELRRLLGL